MFKIKPYDPNREYRKPTPAQQKAQQRNFYIFRLRGLHSQMWLLTGWRRKLGQFLVDLELRRLGAESQTERCNKWKREWRDL